MIFILKIKDLQAHTILGAFDWEKQVKRLVILNLELYISDTSAGRSDSLKDSVDYAMLEQKIVARLNTANHNLIERLVTDIGEFVMSLDTRIIKIVLEADKPGALAQSRSVSVTGEFTRAD